MPKPSKAAPQDLPKSPYTALRALRHNGEDYAAGEDVQLTEPQAKRLVAIKAVEAKKAQ